MKTEEQKQKIGKITLISVGVISILCGVATFCGIYFTTKDYRLVKNDYDIYLNKDKLESDKLDYVYSYEDSNIFTKIDNGYRFNLDNLIDNNPSFKSNDYKISFNYLAKVITESEDTDKNYPSLELKNKDGKVLEKLSYSTSNKLTLEDVCFDDSTDYFDLAFNQTEEIKRELDIAEINLKFFALKK